MSARRVGRWLWERRQAWLWLVVAVLAVLVGLHLAQVWRITNHHDLDVFLLAAWRLAAGEDIYADAGPFQEAIVAGTFSMQDDTVVWPYMYPPLIALLFVPTLGAPVEVVRAGWWVFNVACLLAGTWLCLRALGRVTALRAALALLLLWRYEPATVALRLGQIEVLQYLLLAAALCALNSGRERWAGLALGLAAGLKFFPAALIVLLVWRKRWRAAGWALGTALVTILGSFAVVGLKAIPTYLHYTGIYGITGAFAAFPLNQSLNGFFSRNLVHNVFSATLKGLNLTHVARALTLAADVLVVAASAWLTWWPRRWGAADSAPDQRGHFALQYGLGLAALLLISPHSQVYTFVWALIPLLVLGVQLLEGGSSWWTWLAFVAAYALIGRNVMVYRPGLTRFFQSHYMFGVLLLWGIIGVMLGVKRARHGATGTRARAL